MKIVSSVIQDVIEITNAKGETIKEIPFRVNLTETGGAIAKKRLELAQTDSNDMEKIGRVFCELLEAVFGETVLNELVEHYGNDYTALAADITPIFTDVIFPALDAQRARLIEQRKRIKH